VAIKADEDPVLGGELVVNIDRVVERLAPAVAGLARRNGHLGFRMHVCQRSPR
jgi:hypothetical protein